MEMAFSIGQSVEFAFDVGGSVTPQPEPGGGAAVLTGTPTVQMSGAVLPISSTIYGTAEEVN